VSASRTEGTRRTSMKRSQVTMSFDDFVALLRDWHALRTQRS
jgi:hypothetical protein